MSRKWKLLAGFGVIYIVWGSTFLAVKWGIESLPPFLMMALRFSVAGLLLLTASIRGAGRIFPRREHLKPLFLLSLGLVVLGTGIVAWVEKFVPSGLAALLVGISPVWLVFIESVLPGSRKPGVLALIGVFMGLAGTVLLLGPNDMAHALPIMPVVILLLSTIAWSVGSVYARHLDLPYTTMFTMSWQMLIGGLSLAIVGLVMGELRQFSEAEITLQSGMALTYLIVFGSALIYPIYGWLLRQTSATLVGTHAYVNPVIALFLGWLLADEIITTRTVLAAAIILMSVFLINEDHRGQGKRKKRPVMAWLTQRWRVRTQAIDH